MSGSVIAVAAVAAVVSGTALPASAATTGGPGATWGTAQQVRTGATRQFIGAGIVSQACAARGYCAAVGTYWPWATRGITDPYVVIDNNGSVGKLQHINTAPLSTGPLGTHGNPALAEMDLVACPSAGNCTAVGDYQSFDFGTYPFVVNETNGTWGKAHPVAGIAPLGLAITAMPTAIACTSAGNCVAGGTFDNSTQSENTVPFVVSEKNGVWGAAQAIPGLPTAANIEQGNILLSCARTCLGVGFYQTAAINAEFVVSEHGGNWGTAGPVPGLPKGSAPAMVACSPDGTCTVAGYGNAAQRSKMFTVTDDKGVWGSESLVPGTAITGENYNLNAISCPASGRCSIGGWHATARGPFVPWVATQRGGTWSKAGNVPGLAALDTGFSAQLTNLACGAVGNCAGGGIANVHVTAKLVRTEAFVVSEVNGTWGKGIVVPGIVRLDGDGNSRIGALACSSANRCIAGGVYEHNGRVSPYAFVAVER